jgi:hypothetical protein
LAIPIIYFQHVLKNITYHCKIIECVFTGMYKFLSTFLFCSKLDGVTSSEYRHILQSNMTQWMAVIYVPYHFIYCFSINIDQIFFAKTVKFSDIKITIWVGFGWLTIKLVDVKHSVIEWQKKNDKVDWTAENVKLIGIWDFWRRKINDSDFL